MWHLSTTAVLRWMLGIIFLWLPLKEYYISHIFHADAEWSNQANRDIKADWYQRRYVPVRCVNGKCQQHDTFFNIQDFVERNI